MERVVLAGLKACRGSSALGNYALHTACLGQSFKFNLCHCCADYVCVLVVLTTWDWKQKQIAVTAVQEG
jgi:hypothetical protein